MIPRLKPPWTLCCRCDSYTIPIHKCKSNTIRLSKMTSKNASFQCTCSSWSAASCEAFALWPNLLLPSQRKNNCIVWQWEFVNSPTSAAPPFKVLFFSRVVSHGPSMRLVQIKQTTRRWFLLLSFSSLCYSLTCFKIHEFVVQPPESLVFSCGMVPGKMRRVPVLPEFKHRDKDKVETPLSLVSVRIQSENRWELQSFINSSWNSAPCWLILW